VCVCVGGWVNGWVGEWVGVVVVVVVVGVHDSGLRNSGDGSTTVGFATR
jgi:hypothetical protein